MRFYHILPHGLIKLFILLIRVEDIVKMAYKTSYELHHHFPRLAEESGFTFNTHRPRVHIDWNKIKLIDLDSLIRERKFVVIEQHLNDILDCVFESEFDVRILDEGVMKMFRLAQLAVEYQQFCRHYLDRSVYVLREEITSLAQELDATKKQLQDREEELRKLKRRSRHTYKTPLPYGNDNIAAMILKTLSNKGDAVFPSTSNADALQHNKCSYCEKVFLNQLYLQSHIARRHADVVETLQKEKQPNEQSNENAKMNAEILELRTKLKEMEQAIANASNQSNTTAAQIVTNPPPVSAENKKTISQKNVKDAEVSTNTEEYLLNKFEQWKSEEHAKYNKEINELRTQILETINTIKEKQEDPKSNPKENQIVEQLHSTIQEQGVEIMKLKQELTKSHSEKRKEEQEKSKETEAQILFWSKRAEAQSKQYEALLQKLSDVARDAKESRALAEIERERATQLQNLLQQNINRKVSETVTTSTDDLIVGNHAKNKKVNQVKSSENKKPNNNIKQMPDRHTLDNLHKKAQELLNMGSISSTSSESSSTPIEEIRPVHRNEQKVNESPITNSNSKSFIKPEPPKPKQRTHISDIVKNNSNKVDGKNKMSKAKIVKNRVITKVLKDTTPTKSGSPIRVVRAKLTEEVNSRLASCGVDPLKSRVPQNVFQKQRIELQQMHEAKIKKNPSYEKVRHSILAFLDSNTSISNKDVNGIHEYVSPNKVNKPFGSLTSVISNVKSKALSLVKLNENNKAKRKSLNSEVAKRAMTLIRTPPSSAPESPMNIRSAEESRIQNENKHENTHSHKEQPKPNNYIKTEVQSKKSNSNNLKKDVLKFDSDEGSDESDHKYYNTAVVSESSKSIENLIKSPARRPASADTNLTTTVRKYVVENGDIFMRTQSATNLSETKVEINNNVKKLENINNENSSDDVESITDTQIKKALSDENIQIVKQTKGVLKNASSMSSLNKKKVLFDMDAIQMKSVSASPSQSITEKSDGNEKYELGLVNLDGEEWDISSIENEPLKNDTKIQINTRSTTSPKIAELKQTIESQLARRNDTPSSAIVGGVDILGPIPRVPSIGGSNTSLGSSILDDSDGIPTVNHKAFVKPRKVAEKDDSELDISEFSIDGIANKNESF